jgi:hypothetical protein
MINIIHICGKCPFWRCKQNKDRIGGHALPEGITAILIKTGR